MTPHRGKKNSHEHTPSASSALRRLSPIFRLAPNRVGNAYLGPQGPEAGARELPSKPAGFNLRGLRDRSLHALGDALPSVREKWEPGRVSCCTSAGLSHGAAG